MDTLRFITCGSVDDGKSTLIGRLLFETKGVFEDQWAAVEADSKKYGTQGARPDFALLVDGLQAEREQATSMVIPCACSSLRASNKKAYSKGRDVRRHFSWMASRIGIIPSRLCSYFSASSAISRRSDSLSVASMATSSGIS